MANKFAKENILKYTWKIQSSNICLCFVATQQLMRYARCSYTNSCFCQEGKQVRHAGGFQWKMFASIYQEQKIIGRCNLLVKLQDTCLEVK